jgi:hypothetical protein
VPLAIEILLHQPGIAPRRARFGLRHAQAKQGYSAGKTEAHSIFLPTIRATVAWQERQGKAEERSSFLKKRTKKLLRLRRSHVPGHGRDLAACTQK